MRKRIVILGSSGFAKEILFLIQRMNAVAEETWEIAGFVDNQSPAGTYICGYPVVGNDEWLLEQKNIHAVCAVGNSALRKRIVQKIKQNKEIYFPALIDPSVIRSDSVKMGEGVIICAGNILTVDIKIGNFVTVNLDCTVGHDVVLEDYVTLYPSVNVSGKVSIGEETEVGTGTHIIHEKAIGGHSIIGAGTVVIRDIPSGCTAVGNPARVIRTL